jgi:hypothetical protein
MMSQPIHHRDTETQRDPLTDVVIGTATGVHCAPGAGLLLNFNVPVLKDGLERMEL